jgi:hypothetical protein
LEILKAAYSMIQIETKVLKDIKSATLQFTFIHIFFTRFQDIFDHLSFETETAPKEVIREYFELIRPSCWLIFVLASKIPPSYRKSEQLLRQRAPKERQLLPLVYLLRPEALGPELRLAPDSERGRPESRNSWELQA